ncbi:hypothetical protein LWI28_003473 [Acer negundo]|uniref:Uncharacterized protein n=1 Tax=Acer negundo TaxID=4023 RepID=A0AAD5P5E5_ACENE|nr:hypothetical protein LWI28_003473 [Acer negundo]
MRVRFLHAGNTQLSISRLYGPDEEAGESKKSTCMVHEDPIVSNYKTKIKNKQTNPLTALKLQPLHSRSFRHSNSNSIHYSKLSSNPQCSYFFEFAFVSSLPDFSDLHLLDLNW